MTIDKEKLAGIVAMPDEELWEMIRSVAKNHGIRLPEKCPPHTELEKVRNALTHGASPNIAEAVKVVNNYRKGAKNG